MRDKINMFGKIAWKTKDMVLFIKALIYQLFNATILNFLTFTNT